MAQDAPRYNWITLTPSADTALDTLAADVRAWFTSTIGLPTVAQRLAWPAVARGENLLLATPTGSGKTLAALLPILAVLRPGHGLRCLYVAPLKALCQDVRKNLREHLRGLAGLYPDSPLPRVGLRTGDTSQRVRRQQTLDPPDILLTTPESLAVMLSHAHARAVFGAVRWVIVDEVHAFAPTKRGADLALGLERLQEIAAAPLQRIGLSATCAPLETAADFLVGGARRCTLAQAADHAPLELTVEPLSPEEDEARPSGFIARLLDRLDAELCVNRTTLIFTNTRSLAERVTWALRRRYPERAEDIAAHHSALAAARRRLVERQLKQGRLWAAVTSTSLELGIDIGSVDGVVFVHPPGSVVRTLQRLGRSGHRPNEPRRGLVLTASAGELLEATVTAAATRDHLVESLRLSARPLDVLCQHLVGLALAGAWTADAAFDLVRRAAPYRLLTREEYDDCLDYLSGRRRDGSAWLPSRLSWQDETFSIADEKTARLLRRNLGTIVTEDACPVRLQLPPQGDELPRDCVVGEVDLAYADQLRPGDRFVLDGRCLEVRRQGDGELLVEEVLGRPLVPRWQGAGVPMPLVLARRIFLFRTRAAEALRDGEAALLRLLGEEQRLDPAATAALARYVRRQECVSEVPDPAGLLVEHVSMQALAEYYVHLPLPRPATEALGQVAALRWRRRHGGQPLVVAADLGFVLSIDAGPVIEPPTWRVLLAPDRFAEDLADCLGDGPLLRQAFAHVSQTGLMVLRHPIGRKPRVGGRDWAGRQLFDQLREFAPDFVLLHQAERDAREAGCDGPMALAFATQAARQSIRLRTLTQPSPFGETLLRGLVLAPAEHPEPENVRERLQGELLQDRPT